PSVDQPHETTQPLEIEMYEYTGNETRKVKNAVRPANRFGDERVIGIVRRNSKLLPKRFQDIEELVHRIEGASALVA
ncbi:MAG: hypothetical protein ACR2O1_08065, partial [Boseongicola sp.]